MNIIFPDVARCVVNGVNERFDIGRVPFNWVLVRRRTIRGRVEAIRSYYPSLPWLLHALWEQLTYNRLPDVESARLDLVTACYYQMQQQALDVIQQIAVALGIAGLNVPPVMKFAPFTTQPTKRQIMERARAVRAYYAISRADGKHDVPRVK